MPISIALMGGEWRMENHFQSDFLSSMLSTDLPSGNWLLVPPSPGETFLFTSHQTSLLTPYTSHITHNTKHTPHTPKTKQKTQKHTHTHITKNKNKTHKNDQRTRIQNRRPRNSKKQWAAEG